jgi:hypothetical protein
MKLRATPIFWCLVSILMVFGLVSCQDENLFAKYGLAGSANSESRTIIENSIRIANQALAITDKISLFPSWKSKTDGSAIPVYLLESSASRMVDQGSIISAEKTLADFRKSLDTAKVDPRFENCNDSSDCAGLMYKGTVAVELAAKILNKHAGLNNAFFEEKCKCIALIEPDIQKLNLIYTKLLTKDNESIPAEYFIATILLHEVGHYQKDYIVNYVSSWEKTYTAVLDGLNASQKEEMRADAFAATRLRDSCFNKARPPSFEVHQTCIAALIHPLEYFVYSLFDKSRAGRCRFYLENAGSHPNYYLRYLAIGLIISEKSSGAAQKAKELIDEFLKTRSEIRMKSWSRTAEGCKGMK